MKKNYLFFAALGIICSITVLGTKVSANEMGTEKNVTSQSVAETKSVSTYEEFAQALADPSVIDITLSADIQLARHTPVYGEKKMIHGENHLIDANRYQTELMTLDAEVVVEQMQIQQTDIYGLFWSPLEVKVTYRDIAHSGHQMIYLPVGELIIDGKVTSDCDLEEVYQGKKLTISEDSQAEFKNTSVAHSAIFQEAANSSIDIQSKGALIADSSDSSTPAIYVVGSGGKLALDSNSQLNVRAKNIGISGGVDYHLESNGQLEVVSSKHTAIHLRSGGTMTFNGESQTKAIANDPIEEGVQANDGSIVVKSGATFLAESKGTQGTVITGENLVFERGANFSITNHHESGAVFGSYTVPTSVSIDSEEGIQTWNRGGNFEADADAVYQGPVVATFELSGYLNTVKQTKFISENADFLAHYQTGEVGKITGGSFAAPEQNSAAKPSFNIVNDRDKQLTGMGEVGATITIYAGETVVGTTTVGEDNRWSFPIEPQPAGTVLSVTQKIADQESEKSQQTVTRLTGETVNAFKLGYWQDYALILEGSIDNVLYDLSDTTKVEKRMELIDEAGEKVTIPLTNTDWYDPGVFNGYQAILYNDTLSALSPGDYFIQLTIITEEETDTQDLNVENAGPTVAGYYTTYTDIVAKKIGTREISTENKDGVAYLHVEEVPE